MRRWLAVSLAWGIARLAHRRWAREPAGSLKRGIHDALSHAALALAVTLPALDRAHQPAKLVGGALIGGLLIDLDHVLAARSLRLHACMTMPSRPLGHSPFIVGLSIVLLRRCNLWLAHGISLGLASHLMRDLVTGGVPLLNRRRIVALSERWLAPLACALALSSRLWVKK